MAKVSIVLTDTDVGLNVVLEGECGNPYNEEFRRGMTDAQLTAWEFALGLTKDRKVLGVPTVEE